MSDDWLPRRGLLVLTGLAGSGKTDLLRRLASVGEQTIDLELLANHRGSVFGGIGQSRQPSHRAFGDALAAAWGAFDPDRALWIEEEGPFLGSVGVPRALQRALAAAPGIELVVSVERRRARLVADYGGAPPSGLLAAVDQAAERLGAARTDAARSALKYGRLEDAVVPLLDYYDEAYAQRARRVPRALLVRFHPDDDVAELVRAGAAAASADRAEHAHRHPEARHDSVRV